MIYKNFSLTVKSIDVDEANNLGIIKGYASTFGNIDRDGDIIEKGAFAESIQSFMAKNQKIPMLASHRSDNLIGGYPAELMAETEKGLEVVGQIDLNTKEGREKH